MGHGVENCIPCENGEKLYYKDFFEAIIKEAEDQTKVINSDMINVLRTYSGVNQD